MQDGEGPQDPTVSSVSSLALARRRVLVAEDDPSLRRLIVTVLVDAGHEVIEAEDGTQLLDHIERLLRTERVPSRSFVVVTDVNMPGLTGLDVLAILRCASAHTPVVLITAFGDAETRAEARDLGAAMVLDKPFDVDALRSVVERLSAVDGTEGLDAVTACHGRSGQP